MDSEPEIIVEGHVPDFLIPSADTLPPVIRTPLQGKPPVSFTPSTPSRPPSRDSSEKRRRGRPKGSKNKKTLEEEANQPPVIIDAPPIPVNSFNDAIAIPSAPPMDARINARTPPPSVNPPPPLSHTMPNLSQTIPNFPKPPPPSDEQRKAAAINYATRVQRVMELQKMLHKRLPHMFSQPEIMAMSPDQFENLERQLALMATDVDDAVDLLEFGLFGILNMLGGISQLPEWYKNATGNEAPEVLQMAKMLKLDGPEIDVVGALQASPLYRKTLREVLADCSPDELLEHMSPELKLIAITGFIVVAGVQANNGYGSKERVCKWLQIADPNSAMVQPMRPVPSSETGGPVGNTPTSDTLSNAT